MKFLSFVLVCITLASCSPKRNMRPELFNSIQPEDYISEELRQTSFSQGKNITIPAEKFDPNGYVAMHELFDTITAVKLETTATSLIGTIDKIIVRDSNMYILDKYKTRSIKRFSLQGRFLNAIGACGEGPDMQREPTDFCLTEDGILVLDQFQSKIFEYSPDGNLKKTMQLPFTCIQLYRFTPNNYVFLGVNADNYHLPEILNYSLWQTDSSFVINNRFVYREKDKYQDILERNSLSSYMETLYYKKTNGDTIFSISPTGDIHYDYIINIGKRTLPQELLEKGNERKLQEAAKGDRYAIVGNYKITQDYVYATCSLGRLNYHLFYNIPSGKVTMEPICVNNINLIFPFAPIVGATRQSLIGVIDASYIYDNFHAYPKEEWLKQKGYCKGEAVKIGNGIIDFCKDIKLEDNPIVIFYRLKK